MTLPSRALPLGRLLRLSLAPSALADIAAGCVLGARAWPAGAAPIVLMLSSACVYHGGMALNDWADRSQDARARPERPIPSGAIAPRRALALALLLLLGGPLLALSVAPAAALVLALVAALATLYDLAGRGAWSGPLLLGACRAGNLTAGLVLGAGSLRLAPLFLLAPLAYGSYVFLVSRLARLEDLEPGEYARGALRPGRWMLAASAALVLLGACGALLLRAAPHPASSWSGPLSALVPPALTLLAALGLLAHARRCSGRGWVARDVQRGAGMALRRLLVATAALAWSAGVPAGALTALAILLGYPLSFALRKLFPPT